MCEWMCAKVEIAAVAKERLPRNDMVVRGGGAVWGSSFGQRLYNIRAGCKINSTEQAAIVQPPLEMSARQTYYASVGRFLVPE